MKTLKIGGWVAQASRWVWGGGIHICFLSRVKCFGIAQFIHGTLSTCTLNIILLIEAQSNHAVRLSSVMEGKSCGKIKDPQMPWLNCLETPKCKAIVCLRDTHRTGTMSWTCLGVRCAFEGLAPWTHSELHLDVCLSKACLEVFFYGAGGGMCMCVCVWRGVGGDVQMCSDKRLKGQPSNALSFFSLQQTLPSTHPHPYLSLLIFCALVNPFFFLTLPEVAQNIISQKPPCLHP